MPLLLVILILLIISWCNIQEWWNKYYMEEKLSIIQAYKTMFEFLCNYYDQTGKPDQIGSLLSDIQLFNNGHTADPAAWSDWLLAMKKVLKDKQNQA
jgi:hypothetical protein